MKPIKMLNMMSMFQAMYQMGRDECPDLLQVPEKYSRDNSKKARKARRHRKVRSRIKVASRRRNQRYG